MRKPLMAKEYDETNRGALFGNTRKREGKKDPDLQGKLNVNGVDHWISAWFFTYDKDGEKRKAISLALGEPVEPKETTKKPAVDDDESSIPF